MLNGGLAFNIQIQHLTLKIQHNKISISPGRRPAEVRFPENDNPVNRLYMAF